MRSILTIAFILMISGVVLAESIEYELYDFTSAPEGVLVAAGTIEYSVDDVRIIQKKSKEGEIWWKKILWLEHGYGISASVYIESEVTGFGLTGTLDNELCKHAFSWEWFQQKEGLDFYKIQEGGAVRIQTSEKDGGKVISKVVFETDISLRINTADDIKSVTHRILIKKGSVLAFAP